MTIKNLNILRKFTQASLILASISLLSSTSFGGIKASAIYGGGSGGGPLTNEVKITDPYTCGQDSTGEVTNGIMPFKVKAEFYRNGGLVTTRDISVDSNNKFRISRPDTFLASGDYTIVLKVSDREENRGEYRYNANIKKPEECTVIDTVSNIIVRTTQTANSSDILIRTGGNSSFLMPIAAFLSISFLAASSTVPNIMKKKAVKR